MGSRSNAVHIYVDVLDAAPNEHGYSQTRPLTLPVTIALHGAGGHFKQAIWAVPIQNLLGPASLAFNVGALVAEEEMVEWIQGEVGAEVVRVERVFCVCIFLNLLRASFSEM